MMVQIAHLDELSQNYWVVVLTEKITVKEATGGNFSKIALK